MAVARPRRRREVLDRVAIGHVARGAGGVDAERLQLRGRRIGTVGVDVGDHDVAAGPGQRECDASPDPAATPGHHGDSTLELLHRVTLLLATAGVLKSCADLPMTIPNTTWRACSTVASSCLFEE